MNSDTRKALVAEISGEILLPVPAGICYP